MTTRQITLANQASFEKYSRPNRREQFLNTMETVVPWSELEALIAPYYPGAGNGRQPVGLSIMLRIYFLQHWFDPSDPGAEDALYESAVLRRFTGVDPGRAAAPDESTILNFRHLLEQHELCGKILDAVNLYLDRKGIRISTGTIVDAAIIAAPSSTKNNKKERDPEMHQTRKGNQWEAGIVAFHAFHTLSFPWPAFRPAMLDKPQRHPAPCAELAKNRLSCWVFNECIGDLH